MEKSLVNVVVEVMKQSKIIKKKAKLTNELKCLLKVLLNVLVRRIVRWYLFIFNSWFILCCWWLTGDVENTIGTDTGWIDCVASIAKQKVWENRRCWMRFNIWKIRKKNSLIQITFHNPQTKLSNIFPVKFQTRPPSFCYWCLVNQIKINSKYKIEKDIN